VSADEPVPRRIRSSGVADQEHVLRIGFRARERGPSSRWIVCPDQRCDGAPSSPASAAPKRAVSAVAEAARIEKTRACPRDCSKPPDACKLPSELDRDRVTERRVGLEQAVERRTCDLEQLRITHCLDPADRAEPVRRASSPSAAPGPSSRTVLGVPSRVTTTRSRPDRTTKRRSGVVSLGEQPLARPRGAAALRPPSARRERSDRHGGNRGRARAQSQHPSARMSQVRRIHYARSQCNGLERSPPATDEMG
jgi:hypothetical protein